MAQVTATRSELLARRARIALAKQGRDLLREKRAARDRLSHCRTAARRRARRRVGYNELVELVGPDGQIRRGQVLAVEGSRIIVQVLAGTAGLNLPGTIVRTRGEVARTAVGIDLVGRILDGAGRPIDGGPPLQPEAYRDVNGQPINPVTRDHPSEFIETASPRSKVSTPSCAARSFPSSPASVCLPSSWRRRSPRRPRARRRRTRRFRRRLRSDGGHPARGELLPPAVCRGISARARRALPRPRRRPRSGATAHAACRIDGRRASCLRARPARPRHSHRRHELLRGPARARRCQRGDPRTPRLPTSSMPHLPVGANCAGS